jgi:glycosyltransferase 2 family protein
MAFPRRTTDTLAALGGAVLLAWLLWDTGLGAVETCLARMGPSIVFALVPYVAASLWDALGWRTALRAISDSHVSFTRLWLVRLAGEAVNSAAPTGIGGEPVKAVLLRGSEVSGSDAAAAVVVSRTAVTLTQSMLVAGGITALLVRFGHAWWAMGVLGLLVLAIATFGVVLVRIQLKGPLQLGMRLVNWLLPRRNGSTQLAERAIAVDDRLSAFYLRHQGAFFAATMWHLFAWVWTAGEVWLLFRLVGVPIPASDALIIEGLAQPIRATAIVVPGALGTQEAGGVAMCVWLGIPREAAVAVWLVRRVRELLFDAIGFGYMVVAGMAGRRASGRVVE